MPYTVPPDADARPVAIIGAGTLGRRMALMFAAGGSPVHMFSRSAKSREEAKRFA